MDVWILIGMVVIAVTTLIVVDRRRGEPEERTERDDTPALEYINLFIGTLYMVLLSPIVVLMWQNTSDVNSDVRSEADGLQSVTQLAAQLPAAEGAPLTAAARGYAGSVLKTEWPPTGITDPDQAPAGRLLDQARAAVTFPVASGASAGTVEDEALSDIDSIASARDDRLANSDSGVPPYLLIALALLSLMTIVTPLTLGLRADALAFTGFLVSTTLVCLAFWFVLELQSPYHGLIHASAQPLQEFLANV
jgi:hypothetical protein